MAISLWGDDNFIGRNLYINIWHTKQIDDSLTLHKLTVWKQNSCHILRSEFGESEKALLNAKCCFTGASAAIIGPCSLNHRQLSL